MATSPGTSTNGYSNIGVIRDPEPSEFERTETRAEREDRLYHEARTRRIAEADAAEAAKTQAVKAELAALKVAMVDAWKAEHQAPMTNAERLTRLAAHEAAQARRLDDERLATAADKYGRRASFAPYDGELPPDELAELNDPTVIRNARITDHRIASEKRRTDEAYLRSRGELEVSAHLPLYAGELSTLELRDIMAEAVDAAAETWQR